jgi:protein SCO1/2
MKRRTYIPIACSLLLLFAGILLFKSTKSGSDGFHGRRVNHPAFAFQLKNTKGQKSSLADLTGKVVLLSFGFTQCSSVCPTNLSKLQQVATLLGNERSDSNVEYLFISIDEHSTPEEVQDFIADYKTNKLKLKGLLSGAHSTHQVAHKFNEYITRSVNNKEIIHSGHLFVIDEDSNLALIYPSGSVSAKQLVQDLTRLRRESNG